MAKDMEAPTLLLLLLLGLGAVCEYDDEDDAHVCYYVCGWALVWFSVCLCVNFFGKVSCLLIHRQIFGRD